jgi:hypothetical protein
MARIHGRWSQRGSAKCSPSRLTVCSNRAGVSDVSRAAFVSCTDPVSTILRTSSPIARSGPAPASIPKSPRYSSKRADNSR